ncbi:hypothetical protein, partial [Burkholderia cepacia]|uniref:hypothetical protein n=1 Tax=Burkholderia cepacia TaxID=292 RepID=UPI001C71A137
LTRFWSVSAYGGTFQGVDLNYTRRFVQACRPADPTRRNRASGAPPFSILATRTRRLGAALHQDIGSRPDASSAGYRTELDR